MAAFGQISEFSSAVEPWSQYVERLQQFFLANAINQPERQRAIFLTVVGPSTYGLLKDLLHPAPLGATPLPQLLDVLANHFEPAPSEIIERFKFNSHIRKPGETVSVYIAELCRLAKFCAFGESLDTMLRDRIVCGIKDESIQRKLLSEPRLTLQRATEIAVSMETASRNATDLKSPQFQEVGKINAKSNSDKLGNKKISCYRCGEPSHISPNCRFLKSKCHSCGKLGHLAKVCQATKNKTKRNGFKYPTKLEKKVHQVQTPLKEESPKVISSVDYSYEIFNVKTLDRAPDPFVVDFKIEGQLIPMEIDSGAPFSLITLATYERLQHNLPPLTETDVKLQSFTKHPIETLGVLNVKVVYRNKESSLPLLVVKQGTVNLAGRNWLKKLPIFKNFVNLNTLSEKSPALHGVRSLNDVLEKHKKLFLPELGLIQGQGVHLTLRPGAFPRFCKARSVPYALQNKVDQELDRLTELGILEPVKSSDWAAPVVPVMKPDGSVRLCGDFKLTVNAASELEKYPLPKIEDIFAELAGGVSFSKIDLRDAYCQLKLDEESQTLVVINTHRGLFCYTRLPFGVASAPAIFQREMDKILRCQPGASVYLDDLLVTGSNEEEHLANLDAVLEKLESAGARLHPQKCQFMKNSVEYLGHLIDKEGLHPVKSKVEAISKAPAPKNVDELRSFLGLVTYYSKFLPRMSTQLAPLYQLLHRDVPWSWGKKEEEAFRKTKEALTSSSLLIHFDNDKEVILACDASPYGLGAVLSHPDSNRDRPIAFASRSLTKAEKKYSQIEKEALALVFGVVHFRKYLLGRTFTLLTDHQPLVSLLSETKPVPTVAAARILRWALTLAAYSYKIKYRKGSAHSNADACSRLVPISEEKDPPQPAETVLLLEALDDTPVTAHAIRRECEATPELQKVINYIQQGWPKHIDAELRKFWLCRNDLTEERGVIFRGQRVFIPVKFRRYVLDELHLGHQGISALKSIARNSIWWPGIDKDLEELVKVCEICQQNAQMPPSRVSPWPYTSKAWDHIHIDHAGPFEGKLLLVIIDSGTKWLEVIPVSSTSLVQTIAALRSLFSRFGLPRVIVSDNGTSFSSEEFSLFLRSNGIRHVRTAPYHPQSNGLAERAVRTVKSALRKLEGKSLLSRLETFLFHYRKTPTSETNQSPALLMYGRELRSKLDLLRPEAKPPIPKNPLVNTTRFKEGDLLWARNYGAGPKWLSGILQERLGKVMMRVLTPLGTITRHQDQVRLRIEPQKTVVPALELPQEIPPSPPSQPLETEPVKLPDSSISSGAESSIQQEVEDVVPEQVCKQPDSTPLRRSGRARRPPVRLDL